MHVTREMTKPAFLWRVRTDGHDTVRCLQVDDYKVVVGHWDGVIQTYDVRTYEAFEVLKYRNILYCMQMDHCRLFTGSHGMHALALWLPYSAESAAVRS
jgi:hypothetical protein